MKKIITILFVAFTSLVFAQNYNGTYTNSAGQKLVISDYGEGAFQFTVTWGENDEWGCLFDADGTANTLVTYAEGTNCQPAQTLSSVEGDLSVVTSWGRQATLYRVTLCYETENLIANLLNAGFTTVQSSSVIVGR